MLRSFYNYMHIRPQIGFLAGIVAQGSFSLHNILTDDLLLKEATGLGVFMGAAVATLSFITGAIRLTGIIIHHLKTRKNEA